MTADDLSRLYHGSTADPATITGTGLRPSPGLSDAGMLGDGITAAVFLTPDPQEAAAYGPHLYAVDAAGLDLIVVDGPDGYHYAATEAIPADRITPVPAEPGPGADPFTVADLTVVEFDEVYHVGTLNPDDRTACSYEGEGISVSQHPDEWAQIAKLPGRAWTLSRADAEPMRFVSFHDLSAAQRDALGAWGARQGWVTRQTVHRLRYADADLHDTVTVDYAEATEAAAEADFLIEDQGVDANVTAVPVWRPTAAFPDARIPRDVDPIDVLLACWIRHHNTTAARSQPTTDDDDEAEVEILDGVWWDDEYAPEHLSCPRGVLVRDLRTYTVRRA